MLKILQTYFRDDTSPGLLLYEEFIVADKPIDRTARQQVSEELRVTHQTMRMIFPAKEFYGLLAAVEDCCDVGRNRPLVEDFLANLKQTRTKISDVAALERLPGEAFGGAYRKGDTFLTIASEAMRNLTSMQVNLIGSHLRACAASLRLDSDLVERFGAALG